MPSCFKCKYYELTDDRHTCKIGIMINAPQSGCHQYEAIVMSYNEEEFMEKAKPLCNFCRKKLSKLYEIEIRDKVILCCSDCFHFHRECSRFIERNKETANRIFKSSVALYRYCTLCIYFDKSKEDYCFNKLYTGLGRRNSEYPLSYANGGCRHFKKIQ